MEKATMVIKPNYQRLRAIFGNEAGRVGGLLASADPTKLANSYQSVELDGFVVHRDCFELKQETVREAGAKFLPHVIEPSSGVERLLYATLEYSLKMNEDRIILSIPPKLAPVQAAVFPLLGKDGLPDRAMAIFTDLSREGLRVEYDEAGSIGRRYARADEAGIPLGITVDYYKPKDCKDNYGNMVKVMDTFDGTKKKLLEEVASVGNLLGSRDDFIRLIFRIGEVADYAQGIGYRVSSIIDKSWKLDKRYTKRLAEIVTLVLEEMSKIRETMMSLGFNPTRAMELSIAVEDTEKKVDSAYRSLDLEALDEKMPLRTILIVRDIGAHMENMADLGVDIVDLIRVIALTA